MKPSRCHPVLANALEVLRADLGSWAAVADFLGLSPAYLNNIRLRPDTDQMPARALKILGLRRRIVKTTVIEKAPV